METKRKGIKLGVVVGVFIVLMMCIYSIPKPVMKYEPSWHVVWEGTLAEAAEANPGTGKSGFLEIFWINHTATPNTAFLQNTSATLESWCVANMPGKTPYASADSFNVQIASNVGFDIVVRCRWNKTNCWDYNKGMFIGTDVRVNISVSGGGITIAGTGSGTNVNSRNNTGENYLWTNTYWQNGGNAYYIQKGATSTVAYISLQARY